MTAEERIAAQHAVRMELLVCAMHLRSRDGLIGRAVALGLTRVEVAGILGMTRQHVSAIVRRTESE